jgi:hypothetical protein
MDKLDLTKTDRTYYGTKAVPTEVEFGPLPYLVISGNGAPGGTQYTQSLEALFPLAWTLKFQSKARGRDFVVAKLEGQWWWPDEFFGRAAADVPRDLWQWNLMIRVPDFATAADVEAARSQVRLKDDQPPRLEDVEFRTVDEGPCVQILHVGPYATEPATLAAVHAYCAARGYTATGHHHEIYLSDPRKGEPTKAKTLLRIPVKKPGVLG